jgi:hypothetical protein
VEQDANRPIAWVESPLQLIAAAEWAATQERPIVVALRLTGPQMPSTAEELLARGARFAVCVPYYGIPWELLRRHREWAVGDGFSGQFRLAGSLVSPRRLTLLDDGAQTTAVVDALLGRTGYARAGTHESSLRTLLGGLIRDRMLGMAARERLDILTAFDLGRERLDLLADRGVRVTKHRLDWVRSTARPIAVPGNRVLLGSSLPADGLMPADHYLRWVAKEAKDGPLAYLPHRRETPEMLAAVAKLAGVRIHRTGLPIELVLAGAQEALEVLTLPTSARTTLGYLLEGTGSTISTRALAHVAG